MVEFNTDGSLKLPASMARDKAEEERKLKVGKCILIRQEVVNSTTPKKCVLHLKLSEALSSSNFVLEVYREFNEKAAVPTKLVKISEKEFDIEIGTDFKRCSDCSNLIGRYKEALDAIVKKGNCPYEGRREFAYEDYFD